MICIFLMENTPQIGVAAQLIPLTSIGLSAQCQTQRVAAERRALPRDDVQLLSNSV
jgi:hypothetical protein